MVTQYYTASSLDGFIATKDNSLEWLFRQDIDLEGPMAYPEFGKEKGALVMGATTYEWILGNHETWDYTSPTWVFTHRELPAKSGGGDVHLTQAPVAEVHREMTEAAAGKNIWIVGGGDLVGQFADEGLLDEVWVQYAPVTLGSGAPLLPRELDLELVEVARNRDFMCGRWSVVR
ncbi:dihydrofolate reductase [Nocardioides sp. JQ2195]|uniref:dihydrofolate reductase family protein n=1 Tax=Nocardioides sp. JQ2195 TaxID=2592334 RepID=UPI00143EE1A7|nr:dihydrofolate reductase family protein [Nocardioides sp. JQ2195]QIX27978.1 dihydrofolate reductase [Nocardioides sp. JQ2195]